MKCYFHTTSYCKPLEIPKIKILRFTSSLKDAPAQTFEFYGWWQPLLSETVLEIVMDMGASEVASQRTNARSIHTSRIIAKFLRDVVNIGERRSNKCFEHLKNALYLKTKFYY